MWLIISLNFSKLADQISMDIFSLCYKAMWNAFTFNLKLCKYNFQNLYVYLCTSPKINKTIRNPPLPPNQPCPCKKPLIVILFWGTFSFATRNWYKSYHGPESQDARTHTETYIHTGYCGFSWATQTTKIWESELRDLFQCNTSLEFVFLSKYTSSCSTCSELFEIMKILKLVRLILILILNLELFTQPSLHRYA